MARPPATAPDEGAEDVRLARYRRMTIGLLVLLALGSLVFGTPGNHGIPAGEHWFLLAGSAVFAVVTYAFGLRPDAPTLRPAPWTAISAILVLALAIFVIGGINWLVVLAICAGACGRFGRSPAPAVAASAAIAVAGAAVAVADHVGYGGTFAAIVIGPMTAFFGYTAGRRADLVRVLRRTRADLARAAVAEERLRIARDLHDLLGHSLLLITLKAELAGRVIGTDPDRAAQQIAELESVARQSLSDVRSAVAGYRQPDDNGPSAPDDVGPLARSPAASLASPDDGAGHNGGVVLTRPRLGGSGLAGLAERVRSLGGELAAGTVEPQGFRLRPIVPTEPQA